MIWLEVIKVLVEASAVVDQARSDGATPLFMASLYGHVDVVKMLLNASAGVDQKSNVGVTALFMAATHDELEIVKVLLEAGADSSISWVAPSGASHTALSKAEEKGHTSVAALLRGDAQRISTAVEHPSSPSLLRLRTEHLASGSGANSPQIQGSRLEVMLTPVAADSKGLSSSVFTEALDLNG